MSHIVRIQIVIQDLRSNNCHYLADVYENILREVLGLELKKIDSASQRNG